MHVVPAGLTKLVILNLDSNQNLFLNKKGRRALICRARLPIDRHQKRILRSRSGRDSLGINAPAEINLAQGNHVIMLLMIVVIGPSLINSSVLPSNRVVHNQHGNRIRLDNQLEINNGGDNIRVGNSRPVQVEDDRVLLVRLTIVVLRPQEVEPLARRVPLQVEEVDHSPQGLGLPRIRIKLVSLQHRQRPIAHAPMPKRNREPKSPIAQIAGLLRARGDHPNGTLVDRSRKSTSAEKKRPYRNCPPIFPYLNLLRCVI
jgi:hypothetical protein